MIQLGVETLLDRRMELLADQRVGLVTNPSGVNGEVTPTIDLLNDHDETDLRVLFGPEHGIRGSDQAAVKIDDDVDEKTNLPVKSLYGENRRLRPQMIDELDVVVYDMQDIGCRFYTLIYTLVYALEAVAGAGKTMVVLDRPNPIAPLGMTGNRIDDEFASFIGDYNLPITHAMTVGELARYFNREFDIGAELEVVPLEGWSHDTWFDETELPWVLPSPNMPTLDTATIYPGTCLFEGTMLSEGRGTTKPFELIGAPWIDAEEWADLLNDLGLEGVAFRAAYFVPMFSKHERSRIEGVHVHVLDRDRIDPVQVGVAMLASAFVRYPECAWVQSNGEYFIDKLAGGSVLRKTLDGADDGPIEGIVDDLLNRWQEDREPFESVRREYLLYE